MRWIGAILGLILFVLIVGAIWQYAPEARERAEIRKALKDYLDKHFYKNPQILDIRIYRSYALAIVYDFETLVLFLQKRKGKWEVVIHGNLLTRETIRTKAKGVPDSVFDALKIPKAGTIGGATFK
ncbi:hypothetical protein Q2T83_01715 [Fervidibacter sacchari]|jgi:hypothetical protein|uniref:Succinylglutamate desuccinylase n=1 Tax=Candidatus Fervidibacter sacchari TaxID=1448929 RepID=A0ABT2ETA7_9BACT|nr:hypothetical protein [Candidatus Fervidibacter sacchari]MCS3921090.1 succinylglutamate desuccinylase [Candidatus Fervidibacter sacchari]WKU16555.1 hypothetical protein Q2T83_01715 [Candidatus Fervidibacter sacchari]